MQKAKIGSPLFILREQCAKNLYEVFQNLAKIGFEGIELLGLFGHTATAVRQMLEDCELSAIGNHVPYEDFEKDAAQVIADHTTLQCGYITIGTLPVNLQPGGPQYANVVENLNHWGQMVANTGMKLLYHNHAEEIKNNHNDKTILENILDDTYAHALYLEPDLGWMGIAGSDPSYYLQKYRDRCPVIHFKDYVKTDEAFQFRPVGYGILENTRLYTLSQDCKPAWYVMDHDCSYERNPYDDLAMSLEYFRNLICVSG